MNDGPVMRGGWSRIAEWRSKRRERAEATVTRLRPISPWLLLAAVVVIVAVTWPVTTSLYGIAGNDPARRLEAIKIGLTAAAGTGGAFALLLAFRRQRATEIIATETREAQEREYEQRDRAADASERDAEQRRITELYTKAADQLGSEKAPVRLAGLHALERVAQQNLDQRQTIVGVICAYLRMPYTPPDDQPLAEDAKAHTRYENQRQELQVRSTAQRILAAHLRPDAADTFWTGIDLNLTEAHLHRLDLTDCNIQDAQCSGTRFSGDTGFGGTQFSGNANFGDARFHGDVNFGGAQFDRGAMFGEARFSGDAGFGGTRFSKNAGIGGDAVFIGVNFYRDAIFSEAQFSGVHSRVEL
ncbi:MAG: pentapeptide repeat-containing protein [Pseudonocardiaceae bacterium]